jgi:hypothetical protein
MLNIYVAKCKLSWLCVHLFDDCQRPRVRTTGKRSRGWRFHTVSYCLLLHDFSHVLHAEGHTPTPPRTTLQLLETEGTYFMLPVEFRLHANCFAATKTMPRLRVVQLVMLTSPAMWKFRVDENRWERNSENTGSQFWRKDPNESIQVYIRPRIGWRNPCIQRSHSDGHQTERLTTV